MKTVNPYIKESQHTPSLRAEGNYTQVHSSQNACNSNTEKNLRSNQKKRHITDRGKNIANFLSEAM